MDEDRAPRRRDRLDAGLGLKCSIAIAHCEEQAAAQCCGQRAKPKRGDNIRIRVFVDVRDRDRFGRLETATFDNGGRRGFKRPSVVIVVYQEADRVDDIVHDDDVRGVVLVEIADRELEHLAERVDQSARRECARAISEQNFETVRGT